MSALSLCLLAGGCLFSDTALDPTPDAATESDMSLTDSGGHDVRGGDANVTSPDGGPSPDTGPPQPDVSVPDVGPPGPRDCSQVAHPALFPEEVVAANETVLNDLSFTAYRRQQDQNAVALAFRTTNGLRVRTFEIDAATVHPLASAAPNAEFGILHDIAVGQRVGNAFDIAVSGEACTASAYFWLFPGGGGPIVVTGDCPSPIWAIDYAGGQRPFNGEINGTQRAVYFEYSPAMLQTQITSLSAPYRPEDHRSTPVPHGEFEGWVDGSAGNVVLFADRNQNLFAWDTYIEGALPIDLGFSGRRHQTGFAALDADRYVLARTIGGGVDVSIYEIASGSSQLVETVAVIDDGNPLAVDVASFPGGFATFIEYGGQSWTVQTYSAVGGTIERVCDPFVHEPFNIDTEDVELVAYQEGSALQVAAAVLFRMGPDGRQYINIEGPRWPNYFP